jgi:hypothetical protein
MNLIGHKSNLDNRENMLDNTNPRKLRQKVLSQPDIHISLETKHRITPNNNRYRENESSEDDIVYKLSDHDLELEDLNQ